MKSTMIDRYNRFVGWKSFLCKVRPRPVSALIVVVCVLSADLRKVIYWTTAQGADPLAGSSELDK